MYEKQEFSKNEKKRERGIKVSDNDIQKGWDSVQDKLRMRMRKIESLCVCMRKKERKIERMAKCAKKTLFRAFLLLLFDHGEF